MIYKREVNIARDKGVLFYIPARRICSVFLHMINLILEVQFIVH